MHMGAMQFKQRGREEQAEADGTEAGEKVAKLLGVDCVDLYKNLLKPRIKVGNEFVTQGRNKDQVTNSVGALCKGIFDRLFKWLVKKCNETLDTKQKRNSFIGVLDIAGFEIFDVSILQSYHHNHIQSIRKIHNKLSIHLEYPWFYPQYFFKIKICLQAKLNDLYTTCCESYVQSKIKIFHRIIKQFRKKRLKFIWVVEHET